MSKEIDIISGFSMDETENIGEPSIIIENAPERAIIPLNNNDLGLTNKIDVIQQEYKSDDISSIATEEPVYKEPKKLDKNNNKNKKLPIRKSERKPSYTSSISTVSTSSSYPEYPRQDYKSNNNTKIKKEEPSTSNIPLDFGDIADPNKHKIDNQSNNGSDYDNYTGGGGSDTDSYYSKGTTETYEKSYNPSSSSKFNNQEQYYSSSNNTPKKDEDEEKQDLLIKLQALESRGARLTREFSMKSRIEDIRFEFEKQKSLLERDQSVDFMKNCLVTLVSGIEFANTKFDPIGAKLTGWSESVMENIGSYEAIFEKLHEKYRGTVDVAPELELLMTLATSAFMYHMMQTVFKQAIPNLGPAMMQDPNLMAGLGQAAARAADMSRQQQQGIPTPSNQPMGGPSAGFDIGSLLGSVMQGMQPGGNNFQQAFQNPLPRPVNPRTAQPPMTGFNQTSVQRPGYPMAENNNNFMRPRARDDDENSRITDVSSDSEGSGIRIRRGKSDKKIIDLGDF